MQIDIIQDVSIINSDTFIDKRGMFECIWEDQNHCFSELRFMPSSANLSYTSQKMTLRGLHYQEFPYQQAKLVTCVNGKLWDAIVDLRKESPTYKKWIAFELTARSGRSLYIPKGCAHGFLTLEDNTTLAYLIEGRYMPEQSRVLSWNDPEIGIEWPVDNPILSDRDKYASRLADL
jgi:dTDP-4-dehydrorhamnose 3,5-epimerase